MNIPEAITLNHINPNNTDKKNGEKIGGAENAIPNISGLVTTAVLIRKFGEVQKKIPDASSVVKKTQKKTDCYAKVLEINGKQ